MSYSELIPYFIGLLVILGLVCQLTAFFGYGHEIKHITKLKLVVDEFLGKDSRAAPIKAKQLLIRESIPTRCMVANRAMEIESFAEYSGMVALHDLGAVAAEADAGKLRNAIPGMLIASLLVLGLFGTLLSLRETLQDENLATFITKEGSASASSFQEALAPVLEGFGKAFLASICGVGGTILLIASRSVVRNRREICFELLERLAVNQLLPYYIEPEKNVLQRAAEKLDRGSNHYNDATEKMKTSSGALQKSIEELKTSSVAANKAFGEDGAVVFRLRKFTKAAKVFNADVNKVSDSIVKSTDALKDLSQSNGDLLQTVEKRGEAQVEERKEENARLEVLLINLQKSVASIKTDMTDSVASLKVTNDNLISQFGEKSTKQLELVEELGESQTKKLMEASASLATDNEKLIDGLVKYTNAQNKQHVELQNQVVTLFTGLNGQLAKINETIGEKDRLLHELVEVTKTQSQTDRALQTESLNALKVVSERLEGIASSSEGDKKVFHELPSLIRQQSSIQELNRQTLQDVSKQLKAVLESSAITGKQKKHRGRLDKKPRRKWWIFGKRIS